MAKLLPYFRWYPADAESDSKYAAMGFAEVGLYHRCLNYSWLNDGLPSDVAELARVLRASEKEVRKLWARVSLCFVLLASEHKFRNPRQEEERGEAKAKSLKAKGAAGSRWSPDGCERNANAYADAMPRAYGSESVSESASLRRVVKKKETVDFEERFSTAWDRHKKHRGGVTRLMVVQQLLDVDWDEWDARHVPFCAFWDRAGWTTCAVTMFEWWENGMPLPPPEVGKAKSKTDEILEELRRSG